VIGTRSIGNLVRNVFQGVIAKLFMILKSYQRAFDVISLRI